MAIYSTDTIIYTYLLDSSVIIYKITINYSLFSSMND